MAQNDGKNKHSDELEMNISRVRRAIDFWPEFTGGERQVAGVIADHFNPDEGYAFPGYRYLTFVYGFSSETIASAVAKLRDGLMKIKRSRKGNNCYEPDMQKVEAVLADLKTVRQLWEEQKDASSDKARMLRQAKQGASSRKARVLRKKKRNVQPNAQSNAQHESPKFSPPSDERGQTGSGSGEDRSSGRPAVDLNRVDFTDCVLELEKLLPPFEPFGEYKPMDQKALERSRRGAIREMKKLAHLGWTLDEIRQYVEAYLREYEDSKTYFKRDGKCGARLSSLLIRLLDQCNSKTRDTDDGEIFGWKIPSRFLDKPEVQQQAADYENQQEDDSRTDSEDHPVKPQAANDNLEPPPGPQLRYGTYGGAADPDDPF